MPDAQTTRIPRLWGALGATNGAAAVLAGAFAAHAIADARAADLIESGARWQVASGLGGVAAAMLGARIAAILHGVGAAIFALALYALAAGAPSVLGAVAPIGGVAMIAGWAALAVAFLRRRTGLGT
jgi:uncharacterized membrane protein YgdD (TMEM256/DUF423 family)